MNYGIVKVGCVQPQLKIAHLKYNLRKIIDAVHEGIKKKIQILLFPELTLTAYSCGDLFHQHHLLEKSLEAILEICENTKKIDMILIIGFPMNDQNNLYNCAGVFHKGKIIGIVPKTYLPNYKEFYEHRWFKPGDIKNHEVSINKNRIPFGNDLIFFDPNNKEFCFGIEICEDLWVPVPPSSLFTQAGANLIFNPSASNEIVGKYQYRRNLVEQQSARCLSGYVYCSAGVYESSTDLLYSGDSMIYENGVLLAESKRYSLEDTIISAEIDLQKLSNEKIQSNTFSNYATRNRLNFRKISVDLPSKNIIKLERKINPYPFVPKKNHDLNQRCEEIFHIQTSSLAKRLSHTQIKKVIIGISGGLDSTLALLVCAKTFDLLKIDRKNIIAITMPGFGTTAHTKKNARELMNLIGTTCLEINITEACLQHFKDIGHDPKSLDVTYENVQARERTQILMNIANKEKGLVIGTGDLSEMALGWSTYNGDHISMYAVNCSIPKTLVTFLVHWVAGYEVNQKTASVLKKIIDTPISPELLPGTKKDQISQKTEEIIGPYELHDFFLYHFIRYGATPEKILFLAKNAFEEKYSEEFIKKWLNLFLKRFFSQQFKRSCIPDGPKVGTISLSPRGDWRMPSDADSQSFLNI